MIKTKRNKDKVDLLNIDQEYTKYEGLAVWVANRIRVAMGSCLPEHITQEIINTAKYSLIVSLNNFNEHYRGNKLKKLRLKNFIIYRLYDDINRWWLSTYVGCKSILTQKKYRLYPHSLDDMLTNDENNPLIQEPVNYETPSNILEDKDELVDKKRIVEQIRVKMKLKRYEIDTIMFPYNDYNCRYPNKLTKKRHDNLRQILIKRIKEEYNEQI